MIIASIAGAAKQDKCETDASGRNGNDDYSRFLDNTEFL
jgi:hypothetical protein